MAFALSINSISGFAESNSQAVQHRLMRGIFHASALFPF